jgi:hypothetical protein
MIISQITRPKAANPKLPGVAAAASCAAAYRCCTSPCLDLSASFRLGEVRVELSCSEKPSNQVGVRSKIRFVAAT